MKIDVRLNLLGVLGIKQSELALDAPADTTVASLIGLIDQHNPGFAAALSTDDGDLSPQFVFFVNGRNAVSLDGMKTRLSAGDVINVIPAIAGG
ncbi:MoaD/ThiS family protein [Aromatoleum petrolei]|uniref:Molybdopterin synthase sulfur carrier subunit n=1 Tax=Aromatoleum petrolei TaxID=76116 RepID=A0ABX1MLY7_9RHOO|nr:MoaD/ThiS family protein [Aromatoleum petrolei]NMF88967.1 molybdopterin synthase sulfur carrier subunit [Aromatoleum petrolei]QTQ34328.1 Putative molybdopterin synthase, sulfur carrier This/MoaD-like domain-containing [Aromatoleum petrolei]